MSGDGEDDATGHMIVWPIERLARLMRAREHDQDLNPAQRKALRFLARANRFSNSPGALSRYLGATKGTVSQTLMALARKGYVSKAASQGSAKSVSLTLTEKGREALLRDPWASLAQAAEDLGGKTRRRMGAGWKTCSNENWRARILRASVSAPPAAPSASVAVTAMHGGHISAWHSTKR